MSILIKGMEMPKTCNECRFAYRGACIANIGREVKVDKICPLVEFSPPRGEWTDVSEKVWVSEIGFTSAWECSNCHTIFPFYSNYCPNCGAKMEGDGEE